jgi:hypothetical protein
MPKPMFNPSIAAGRKLDWDFFWLREVLFLSAPVLVAVSTLPRGEHMHAVRLAVVLTTLLGLTLVNLVWMMFSKAEDHGTTRRPG